MMKCSGILIPRRRHTSVLRGNASFSPLKERLQQCVNDETLLTFMAEVESLMNSRPLTHVSIDYRNEEAWTE